MSERHIRVKTKSTAANRRLPSRTESKSMFRLRKTRRPDRSNLTHSHKLGVELMECRMMLSATGFEAPQPVPDLTQSTLVPAQISLTGAYVSLSPSSPDGGWTISGMVTDVQLGNTSSSNAFTNSNVTEFYYNSADLNSGPLQSRALQVYDSPLLSGSGLKPEVIATWPSSGALESTSQPVVIGPSPSMPGISEGGSIPIHAIFADFRKDSQLASGIRAISS